MTNPVSVPRELLPCPFCGGKALRSSETLDERYGYAKRVTYRCTGCGCERGAVGDTSRPGYADNSTVEQRARNAWNRRAAPVAAPSQVDVRDAWISVEERLPIEWDHPNGSVEVVVSDGSRSSTAVFFRRGNTRGWRRCGMTCISHWRSLPTLAHQHEQEKGDE